MKHWFRRFDKYYKLAKQRDPESSLTTDELADMYLNHSGLDQKERRDVWKEADGERDPILIHAAILRHY